MSYELTRWVYSAAELEQRLQESGGELDESLEAWLAAMEIKLPASVDNAKLLMDRLETIEKEWRERAQKVSKVAKALATAQERVKDRIKLTMLANGHRELLGNEYRLVLSELKPKLVIEDEIKIGRDHRTETTTWEINKQFIQECLENGITVPGARLQESQQLRSYFNKGGKK